VTNFLRLTYAFILLVQLGWAGTWVEIGSAGPLPATAQRTAGTGSLDAIFGNLIGNDEVDTYLIRIVDPLGFSAATLGGPFFIPDPKLFLFDIQGLGVYANDDANGSQSELPAAHPLGPMTPGLYYLSIARFDNTPLSLAGPVFEEALGVAGPDSIGGALPVSAWNGDVSGRIDFDTFYEIDLTGAEFSNVPEPATWLLMSAGMAGLILRRRRG
jgi:PEP-CTERM motif